MSVVKLSEITDYDSRVYGGKAASLAKLLGSGIPVPDGFVIDVDSYDSMTKELEEEIYQTFTELGSAYVAVRSSAVAEDSESAAWAGQLDTFLNTTEEHLISNIRKCWESLQSERAQSYAEEHDIDLSTQKVAVVVQAMMQSDVSGVAFSVHPVTQSHDHVVIEAALGLGEAVVSGQVTPDMYVVDKETDQIELNIAIQSRQWALVDGHTDWQEVVGGDKQKLTNESILDVSKLVQRLESLYGRPVDVEWLMKDDTLYITQSRPITTL